MQKSSHRYYEDAYTTRFSANVIAVVDGKRRRAVVLDQTYFYPTSGGQPHDTGSLNGRTVVDVSQQAGDGAILHWLADGNLSPGPVTAVIDWDRRFDHMQQHTGQHILSQAFIQVADAATASFHLSNDSVTIDLATSTITPEQLNAAELLANQVVWENRPVHVRFVSEEAARQMDLRKIPDTQGGSLRVVEVEAFDQTACGGTHVAQTGAVGLIKIVKQERIRGQVRIGFCCGKRAMQDYGHKQSIVATLMNQLTTGSDELHAAVTRLQEELKKTKRELQRRSADLMGVRAERLLADGTELGEATLVTQVFADLDAGQLRQISQHLARQPRVIALLGLAGEKSFLLFARAEDGYGDMRLLLQSALANLGGRGGGTAVVAQGGGPAASAATVQRAIEEAVQSLHNEVK